MSENNTQSADHPACRGAAVSGTCETSEHSPAPRSPIDWAFTGGRLRALRERQDPPSPLPAILDPQPHLHIVAGKPKSGKTTFALHLAKSWAEGRAPWPGAPELLGTRALVISREQPACRIESILRRLDQYGVPAELDRWPDRVLVVARDRDLPDEAKKLLCLDEKGLRVLRKLLQDAKESGDPIGLVILDSLSRLKPLRIEESDNDAMSQWLDSLEAIALKFGVYILLIHHQGHAGSGSRAEPRSAARGASAIGAVAAVTMLLERITNHPRQRRLKVDGSFVMEDKLIFNVANENAPPGAIHYFRLEDPYSGYDAAVLIPADGISKNELAWRLSGRSRMAGRNPPGAATRLANELSANWESRGITQTVPGPRGAQIIRLKSHFVSSPQPTQGTEAQSGNLTSPSVPIEAHAGGEEDEDSRRASLEQPGEDRERAAFSVNRSHSMECRLSSEGSTSGEGGST